MAAANAECALIFSLSPGNAGDAPQGRKLLSDLGPTNKKCGVIMDRAYEGNATQQLCRDLGYFPVVPPNPNRLKPWEYDKELYKKRNEVERFFGVSRDLDEYLPDMTNLMLCFVPLSFLLSSLWLLNSVNMP